MSRCRSYVFVALACLAGCDKSAASSSAPSTVQSPWMSAQHADFPIAEAGQQTEAVLGMFLATTAECGALAGAEPALPYAACTEGTFLERARSQDELARCGATLVADDVIVIPKHCLGRRKVGADVRRWFVRGYDVEHPTPSDAYSARVCAKGTIPLPADWALLRLDRKVEGVTPVELMTGEEVKQMDVNGLRAVHYPLGTPRKTSNVELRKIKKNDYRIRSSFYNHSSGAAILAKKDGRLAGMMFKSVGVGLKPVVRDGCMTEEHCPGGACMTYRVIPSWRIAEALETIDKCEPPQRREWHGGETCD